MVNKTSVSVGKKIQAEKESQQAYIWIVLHENVCLGCSIIEQDDP